MPQETVDYVPSELETEIPVSAVAESIVVYETGERPPSRLNAPASGRSNDLLLTLAFTGIFLVQLAHHQMWRDELNAFGIAVASPTLSRLFHTVHYEGHPWLWYALLWLVSRVTVFPIGMKALQACIGIGIYLCIGVRSPFSRPQKLLLFLSYFVLFEYTVISRMYGLMLLLALLYVRRRTTRPARVLGNALLLGLLASCDVMGLILSAALAFEFVSSPARRILWMGQDQRKQRRRMLAAAAMYCGLLLLSAGSILPAKDISTRTTGRMFAEATKRFRIAEAVVDYTVMPYFPTVTGKPGSYWGALSKSHWTLFVALTPAVWLLYWITLRRHRHLLVLQGSAMLMVMLFADLFYNGSTRHFGVTFIAFVACLWIMRHEGHPMPGAAYPLLALSVIGGLVASAGSWRHPFSNAGATAAWLREQHLDTLPLIGTPDTSVVGVAEVLHKPIYMLDCDCEDTFVLFSSRRDAFSSNDLIRHLALAKTRLKTPELVYLGTEPFTTEQESTIGASSYSIAPLTQFTGAEAGHENFFVYRLRATQN